MFRPKRFKLAAALTLALLLTAALALPAAAQAPPPVTINGGGDNTGNTTITPPPSGDNTGGGTNPPPIGGGGGGGGGGTLPPGGGDNNTGGGGGGGGSTAAPSWPPSNMIVTHAATQVQLASVNDGLQTYFIGPGGVGHSGPWIKPFASLAADHPTGGAVTLYTGSNPGTGKPVTIYYLASEKKIRISTYYPDTQYDTNKPYVFTVDSGHNVTHDQW